MTALITSNGTVVDVAPFTPVQVNTSGTPLLAASSVPLSMWGEGVPVVGGKVVSFDQVYRTQPWVRVMVSKIVRQVARLPLKVYRTGAGGSRERVREGPLVELLSSPTGPRGRHSAIDLKQWLLHDALVNGNSLVRKVRDDGPGGPPTRLIREPWAGVEWTRNGWGVTTDNGRRRLVDFADSIHVSWQDDERGLGVSPLAALGVTVRIEDAAQQQQAAIMQNGMRVPYVLSMDKEFIGIDPEERTQIIANLRADIDRLHTGPANSGRTFLAPPGVTPSAIGYSAVEAELIDQRRLTREEIAAVFDIPPPLVGILDHATYSNVSEMHRMLFTTVLGPWIRLLEESLMAQLVRGEAAFDGLYVEFELKDVLRGDPVAEAQALTMQVSNGQLTINEARAVMNRPAFDNPLCDEPLIPANNLAPIGAAPADAGELPAST